MSILKIIFALTLITLFSCNGSKKENTVNTEVMPDFIKSYTVYGAMTATNRRVILIHGLGGSGVDWNFGVHKLTTDGLISDGAQVIVFDLPKLKSSAFVDGGLQYRTNYKNFLDWLVEDTNTKFGVAAELILGGVSYGGLHAFMGAAITTHFDKYFASLPVTHLNALIEYSSVSAPYFNPFNEVVTLSSKPGMVHWGSLDSRVNYLYTVELVNLIGPNTVGVEHSGLDHTSVPEIAASLVDWVAGR